MPRPIPEERLIPYRAGEPPGSRWLYLAPHPDDEVLGAGGTLILAADRGVDIRIAVVTGGDAQGDASTRRRETERAAAVMGVSDLAFLGFDDRSLEPDAPELREAIRGEIERHRPDVVFVPAPVDLHPDHRAVAMATRRALRRTTLWGLRDGAPRWIAAYEVAIPLLPTLLVDVDPVWERKRKALACHSSQLDVRGYDRVMVGLGAVRSLTLEGVQHAEALHLTRAREVAARSLGRWAASMGSVRPLAMGPG